MVPRYQDYKTHIHPPETFESCQLYTKSFRKVNKNNYLALFSLSLHFLPFYYTINHNFYQDSCNFKANLQLKPRFVGKTHIFSTLFYYFLPKLLTIFNFSTQFSLLFFYYYYYIIVYIIYIILLKSNT